MTKNRETMAAKSILFATNMFIIGLVCLPIACSRPQEQVEKVDNANVAQGSAENKKTVSREAEPAEPNVQIEKAIFGTGRGSQNVTARIREIVKNQKAKTTISTSGMKIKNPSGRARDKLKINYVVNGTKGYLELKNRAKVNIYQAILDHNAQTVAAASQNKNETKPNDTKPPEQKVASNPSKPKPQATEKPGEAAKKADPAPPVIAKSETKAADASKTQDSDPKKRGDSASAKVGEVKSQEQQKLAEQKAKSSAPGSNQTQPKTADPPSEIDPNWPDELKEAWAKAQEQLKETKQQQQATAQPKNESSAQTIVPLPEFFDNVRTGGGGRYLIFHIKKNRALFVLDCAEKKIVKEIPVPETVVFAAGKDKLLIGLPREQQLQRWDLSTLQREKVANLDRQNLPDQAAMGSNSAGPLLLSGNSGLQLWDIETLKPINSNYNGELLLKGGGNRSEILNVSPNGRFYCVYDFVFEYDNGVKNVRDAKAHTKNQTKIRPNNDGSLSLGYGRALAHDLKMIPIESFSNVALFPCVDQRYFLAIKKMGDKYEPTIYTAADLRPIFTDKPIQSKFFNRQQYRWDSVGSEQIAYYMPELNQIVFLTDSRKEVIFHEFDLQAAPKNSGNSYLYVNSKPDISVRLGETFRYQISALSSSPVTYKLESGPDGMTVTPSGQVTWTLEPKFQDQICNVIIEAANTEGNSFLHAFEIPVKTKQVLIVAGSNNAAGEPSVASPGDKPAETAATPGTFVTTFDSKFNNVATGGNGRYMVFHFEETGKLAIFDCTVHNTTKEIDVPKNMLYAASKEKLIIIDLDKKELERWDLQTLRRERSINLDRDCIPKMIAMGANSDGPLGMWNNGTLELWDIQTLKRIVHSGPTITDDPNAKYQLSAAANGSAFCGYKDRDGYLCFLSFDGASTQLVRTHDMPNAAWYWAMPSDDGARLLRHGGHAYASNLKLLPTDHLKSTQLYPSGDPRYLVAVEPDGKDQSKITICTSSDFAPVYSINKLPDLTSGPHPNSFGRLGVQPRVRLLSEQNQLITLPFSNDRVVTRSFDLKGQLEAEGDDYLFVTSSPPQSAFVDETFSYEIQSLTNGTWVKYSLEAGPKGMSLEPGGQLKWAIKDRPIGGTAEVVVTAKNSEDVEFKHTFMITVKRELDSIVNDPVPPEMGKWYEPRTKTGYVALDDTRLELARAPRLISPGIGGQMLLLADQDLVVLDSDGWTVKKVGKLDKVYDKIGEREKYYVAIKRSPAEIFLIDKSNLKVSKSFRLPMLNAIDLALHPKEPISFVTGDVRSDIPSSRFVMFDEKSGTGTENEEWIGQFAVIDSSGLNLYTAYSDLYERGSKVIGTPQNFNIVPDYGNIDWLLKYRIDRDGRPTLLGVKTGVGANCKGLRLSADGKRIVYLSVRGYPDSSKNLGSWNAHDLDQIPVTYPTNANGSPAQLVMHPTLPIVASPSNGPTAFFNRESGRLENNRLNQPLEYLKGHVIYNLYFSPDGESFVFDGEFNGIRYLHKYPQQLTREEKDLNKSGLKLAAEIAAAAPPPIATVPLAKLDALIGGASTKMSNADIADHYTESVPIVLSGSSSGTGFVVGSSGYVFTCAHCISDETEIELMFKPEKGDPFKTKAKLIAIDHQRDLALLKTAWKRSFKPIRLSIGREVKMGSEVSVLGHPGSAIETYEFTMTSGIVSSPHRDIEGVSMIQTSATINTGNSGGPMFDSSGFVIGMVAKKSIRVEGAGFAISSEELGKFLMQYLDKDPASLQLERDWFDKDNRGPLTAKFVEYKQGSVKVVRTTDNQEFTLKLEDLSEADQSFIKMFRDNKHKALK